MRHILTLLVVASVTITLPAMADEPPTPAPEPETVTPAPSGNGAALAPQTTNGLANVHGGLKAQSARVAGESRDIELSAANGPSSKPVRPTPTPRVLRKMGTDRAVAAVDPGVRACAAEGSLVAPTTFGLRVSIAPSGEVEGAELASTTRIAPALLKCVVKAIGGARFGAPGAAGASIVVPITVPGRPASVGVAVAPAAPAVTVTVIAPAAAPTPAPESKPDAVAAKQ